jgi:hypothetical protein
MWRIQAPVFAIRAHGVERWAPTIAVRLPRPVAHARAVLCRRRRVSGVLGDVPDTGGKVISPRGSTSDTTVGVIGSR